MNERVASIYKHRKAVSEQRVSGWRRIERIESPDADRVIAGQTHKGCARSCLSAIISMGGAQDHDGAYWTYTTGINGRSNQTISDTPRLTAYQTCLEAFDQVGDFVTEGGAMSDSFDTHGYLSEESEQFRVEQWERTPNDFTQVRQAVATALEQLKSIAPGHAEPGVLAALGFWLRCLEACQGVVLLAERGMASSALALLRTAYECLFYACALWRKPELADRLEAAHHCERTKQARAMLDAGRDRIDPERLAELEAIAAEIYPHASFSAWDAASAADLRFEYVSAYRGLGLIGARAPLRSLDAYYTEQADGSFDLTAKPEPERVAWILGLVNTCIRCGMHRLREVDFSQAGISGRPS